MRHVACTPVCFAPQRSSGKESVDEKTILEKSCSQGRPEEECATIE
jgi:hypothetical protein